MNRVRLFALLAGSCCTASLLFGQLAISTHSGLIQFTSGSVYLQDKLIRKTATNLPDVKKGEELRTAEDSNAEILLTPGVFLRLGSQSSVRMDANALSNTRLTLLTGTAMIEADELLDGNAVTITVGNKPIEFLKPGLFRLSAEPASVAAIKGEALVAGSDNITVKKGKELALNDAVPQLGKFHLNKKDDLFLFSDARSADSAYATGVASHSLAGSGFSCTGSSWYLMGGVGMYSYVPCNGIFSSPFGYAFYGLDYGMMYGGPFYYVPPAAYYYGGAYTNSGGGGGGGTAVAGKHAPGTAFGSGSHSGQGVAVPGNGHAALPDGQSAVANNTMVPAYIGPGNSHATVSSRYLATRGVAAEGLRSSAFSSRSNAGSAGQLGRSAGFASAGPAIPRNRIATVDGGFSGHRMGFGNSGGNNFPAAMSGARSSGGGRSFNGAAVRSSGGNFGAAGGGGRSGGGFAGGSAAAASGGHSAGPSAGASAASSSGTRAR